MVRRFGSKVYFGDPARPDLLRAAGAEHAKVLVVAVDDVAEALKVVDVARRTFPSLTIVSRARNRRHAHLLMERGIGAFVRDTFHSSLRLSEGAGRARRARRPARRRSSCSTSMTSACSPNSTRSGGTRRR